MPPIMANILVHLILGCRGLGGSLGLVACALPGSGAERRAVRPDRDERRRWRARLQWVIAADTYLYRDRISAAATGGQRLSIVSEPGEIKDDPNFGPVEIYRDRAEASVPGAALAGLREVRIAYQGCAEKGICYPPVTRSFRLASAGRAVRRGPRYGGCSHPVPVCHRRRPSGESE